MKHIVSISLGSSRRNHQVKVEFGGTTFWIERIGTDGDKQKAVQLISELDGKVSAFGLGGTDLYIYAGSKRYTFRQSLAITAAARKTPIVDGSGLKNTLERRIVSYLDCNEQMQFKGRSVLLVCAVDRFGLAEALVAAGSRPVFGDIMFGLGIPLPIYTLRGLSRLARMIAPFITKLPIDWFYPTGARQLETRPRFVRYFDAADIIAGDFHFIRRNMPNCLTGKTVITNTVTAADEVLLKERGVAVLVTTTPDMGGRSFGTNILEAMLVAASGKHPEQLAAGDYEKLLVEFGIQPRVKYFDR